MKATILTACILLCQTLAAQNKTDVSLFLRSDSTTYLNEVSSESGDLFNALGHHGPALENEWLGLRLYFDRKAAIDVYSKIKPGKYINCWISSANAREQEINTLEKFIDFPENKTQVR